MTRKQKAELRSSELKTQLNQFSGKNSLTSEESAEAAKLESELRAAELEYRSAIREEAEQAANAPVDPQLGALERRCELRSYLASVADGRPFTGAELEYQQAQNLSGDHVPIAAFAPRVPETRADATTNAPSSTGQSQRTVLGRVFATSAAAFLGVRFDSVPAGATVYPVISAGQDAKRLAAGADYSDIAAATITATTLKGVRSQTVYSFRYEDAAAFGSSLESALRADMSMALAEQMDALILNGNGTAPNPSGLWGATSAPTDGTTVVTFQTALAAFGGLVDGRYAMRRADMRACMASDLYGKLSTLYIANNRGDQSAIDVLENTLGGVQVSAHAPAASSQNAHCVVRLGEFAGAAVAAVWPSVRLIRDETSNFKEGRVNLSMVSLWNFALLRADAYKRLSFHLA